MTAQEQIDKIKDHLRSAEKEIFAAEEVFAWDDQRRHEIYKARVELGRVQNIVRAWEKENHDRE